MLGDDMWACFHDIDSLFLTPSCGLILETYADLNPDAGILTCLTNRLSELSSKQLLGGKISEDPNIKNHIALAKIQESQLFEVSEINKDISGVLMMISKRTWKDLPFSEDGKCLGVDTYYGRALRSSGKKILRMNGLYIWHTYRIINGIHDKSHLK